MVNFTTPLARTYQGALALKWIAVIIIVTVVEQLVDQNGRCFHGTEDGPLDSAWWGVGCRSCMIHILIKSLVMYVTLLPPVHLHIFTHIHTHLHTHTYMHRWLQVLQSLLLLHSICHHLYPQYHFGGASWVPVLCCVQHNHGQRNRPLYQSVSQRLASMHACDDGHIHRGT